MKFIRWNMLAFAMTLLAAGQTAGDDLERPSGLKMDPSRLVKPSDDRMSLSKEKASSAVTTNDVMRQFADEAVFLNVAGQDVVRWRLIREHIEDAVNNFPARPDMGREGYEAAKQIVFQTKLKKLLERYIQFAVMAVEARRLGIKIDPAEFEKKREESRRYYSKKGKSGEKFLSFIGANVKESFYEHNLTNALLWRAYADQVVRPTFTNTAEEISQCVAQQHQANVDAVATNDFKRKFIHEIHHKVKGGLLGFGKMDFSEAARRWSECPSSDNGGLLTDQDEKPQKIVAGDVREEMEAAYRKLQPGEISDVVETPFSWHIIKLLARHPATETDSESVEMAHIMLEKALLIPELTADQASQKISDAKVKVEMKNRFVDLFKTTKIDCLVELVDKRKGGKRKGPRKRIIKAGRGER